MDLFVSILEIAANAAGIITVPLTLAALAGIIKKSKILSTQVP